mmetsp:Transcript_36895/g.105715  ORF Transcript_36895/g.105715 Transcript_36895/m.105715 type:complete len:115 (+) Transcript_36895:1-345(+)
MTTCVPISAGDSKKRRVEQMSPSPPSDHSQARPSVSFSMSTLQNSIIIADLKKKMEQCEELRGRFNKLEVQQNQHYQSNITTVGASGTFGPPHLSQFLAGRSWLGPAGFAFAPH